MADAYRSRFKFPRGDAVNKTIIGRAPFGNIPSHFRPHPAQSDGSPEELARKDTFHREDSGGFSPRFLNQSREDTASFDLRWTE